MQLHVFPEPGSYVRFFVEMVAMFLIVTALAFCLITAAYANENTGGAAAPNAALAIENQC
jgi:hypothetical protein